MKERKWQRRRSRSRNRSRSRRRHREKKHLCFKQQQQQQQYYISRSILIIMMKSVGGGSGDDAVFSDVAWGEEVKNVRCFVLNWPISIDYTSISLYHLPGLVSPENSFNAMCQNKNITVHVNEQNRTKAENYTLIDFKWANLWMECVPVCIFNVKSSLATSGPGRLGLLRSMLSLVYIVMGITTSLFSHLVCVF